jgi:hypothetical protein
MENECPHRAMFVRTKSVPRFSGGTDFFSALVYTGRTLTDRGVMFIGFIL